MTIWEQIGFFWGETMEPARRIPGKPLAIYSIKDEAAN
jgi:hypothetical protein